MIKSSISDEQSKWLHENAELLLTLREELPPTVNQLIEISKQMYLSGNPHDNDLYNNLMLLSGLHSIAARSEYCAYPIIASHLDATILGEADQPDLITKDGYPIEVKVGNFNKAALIQLERYIDKLNASHGIACGKKLSVPLPTNISFIQIEFCSRKNSYTIVSKGDNENE